jgi:hypothetical protein
MIILPPVPPYEGGMKMFVKTGLAWSALSSSPLCKGRVREGIGNAFNRNRNI